MLAKNNEIVVVSHFSFSHFVINYFILAFVTVINYIFLQKEQL